jgi:hypothetical protein
MLRPHRKTHKATTTLNPQHDTLNSPVAFAQTPRNFEDDNHLSVAFAAFMAIFAPSRLCAHQPPEFCTINQLKTGQPAPEKAVSSSKGSRDPFQSLTTYVNCHKSILHLRPLAKPISPSMSANQNLMDYR